ncbi:flavodoxin reductase [Pedobacter psychrophilus]|uniref:Flavodoxin reductase n=1 Tax=Pedobacter psychrophilus TaxID=1826909 RepID=A0A179DMG0_9SPHI|nr:flavodoxin reductase [Pedobacter psychrophilus]OAQ42088.1 flavodoxin reductase [Pedobacter psychrophilus]
MANYKLSIEEVTPMVNKVFKIKTNKPSGYKFTPGQATDLTLQYEKWADEERPFTFTSLPKDNYLEFIIKTYPEHEGVTKRIATVGVGDEFEIGDAWDAINYNGEGIFIAEGAGITSFISIFRDLNQKGELGNNQLIFSNKFEDEIICFEELKSLLGGNFMNVITEQKGGELPQGKVDEEYIKKHINNFNQPFYICGAKNFTNNVINELKKLGAKTENIIFESY